MEDKVIIFEKKLKTNSVIEDMLNKRYKILNDCYNDMNAHFSKVLRNLTTSKDWVKDNKKLYRIYEEEKKCSEPKGKLSSSEKKELNARKKELAERKKEIFKKRNDIFKENKLSEYGFYELVPRFAQKYSKNIPSNMAIISIGARLWTAYEKVMFSNGEFVHFKKKGTFNSMATNGKSGMRLVFDEKGNAFILFSNRKAKAKEYKVPVEKPVNDYEDFMFRQLELNAPKVVRVVRRESKGRYRYYVQFTLKTPLYIKKDNEGNDLHCISSNKVAINNYRNFVVAFNDNEYRVFDLTKGLEEYQEEKAAVQRKMDENTRALNPDNFAEDGTIKKGPKKWIRDEEYFRLKKRYHEICRIRDEQQVLAKRKMVWSILEMGNDITIFDTPYDFKKEKPEFDAENPPSQKEMRKKARDRRAIQEGAPSELFVKLNQKLALYGMEPAKKVKVPEEIFWYKHDVDSSSESNYRRDGMVSVAGTEVESVLYHAYILLHYDVEKNELDKKGMKKDFKKYFDSKSVIV